MTANEGPVLVALSGGVDSTVCAKLLKDEGRVVSGVYFIMSDAHLAGTSAAADAAERLGIPFKALDLRESFYRAVAEPFCRAYCAGRTPSPCLICNPLVKFRELLLEADRQGVHWVATGHYAQVEQKNGCALLRRALSEARDQSYMLAALTQTQLLRCIFPLGSLEKEQVRHMAAGDGLPQAESPDSQEICFIPDGDYPAYIARHGFSAARGRFISPEGLPLGEHRGVDRYTIGQRRGLGMGFGRPVYVRSIEPSGDILLGDDSSLLRSGILLDNCNVNPLYSLEPGREYKVKIRSAAPPAPCRTGEGRPGGIEILFDSPLRAPAPGQYAVLYSGDCVAACGEIAAALPLNS